MLQQSRHRRRGNIFRPQAIGVPSTKYIYVCNLDTTHAYYEEEKVQEIESLNKNIRDTVFEALSGANNKNIQLAFCVLKYPYINSDNNLEIKMDTHFCVYCISKHWTENKEQFVNECFYDEEEKDSN